MFFFSISLLTRGGSQWGTEWKRRSEVCSSFLQFSTALRTVFDLVAPAHEASLHLLLPFKRGHSLDECVIEFWTFAASSEWNESALCLPLWIKLSESLIGWSGSPFLFKQSCGPSCMDRQEGT